MLKKVLPHLISVIAFYAIACAFYSPVVFEDKRLVQGDTNQFIGMSHETLSYEDVEGERPQWADSMFGGMPTVQITGAGIMTFPKWVWKLLRLLMSPEVMTLFLAMLSAYVLALCLKAPPLVSFIAGATFGLASINVLYLSAGHATKVRAISLMPGVLGGVIYALRHNMWCGAGITAFFLAMHIDANHLQMTYYLLFLIGAVGIGELIASALKNELKPFMKKASLLVAAAFVALLPSLPNLQLTKDYSQYTTRGEVLLETETENADSGLDTDYILEYSLSRGEWLSMIVPNIKGGENKEYWGEQRFSGGAIYFGAIAFALFVAFFFLSRDVIRWPVLGVTLLAIILSWKDASFITDLFLDYVPMFNKFRDTKMMLVVVQVSVALGVAYSLKKVWDKAGSGEWKPFVYPIGGVAGLLLVFLIVPEVIFDFAPSLTPDRAEGVPDIKAQRLEIFNNDVFRSLGLIVVALGVIVTIVKGAVKKELAFAGLAVLMLFDIYSVDKRYSSHFDSEINVKFPHQVSQSEINILNHEASLLTGFDEKFEEYKSALEEDLDIKLNDRTAIGKYMRVHHSAMFRALNSMTHFRVLNWANPMNDARTSYFFKSVGGYHGAKLRRYQDFITHVILPENMRFSQAVQATGNVSGASGILKGASMLNTKYIIGAGEDPIPLFNNMGPAWVVHDIYKAVSNEDELFAIENTDVANVAIVHEEFGSLIVQFTSADSTTSPSRVELVEYHPMGSTYKVSGERNGLLVLSEIWYPEGWTATVDGVEVPLVRANYILRALPIEAGDHEVVLSFESPGARRAGLVGGLGSIVLMLFMAFAGFKCCRD